MKITLSHLLNTHSYLLNTLMLSYENNIVGELAAVDCRYLPKNRAAYIYMSLYTVLLYIDKCSSGHMHIQLNLAK